MRESGGPITLLPAIPFGLVFRVSTWSIQLQSEFRRLVFLGHGFRLVGYGSSICRSTVDPFKDSLLDGVLAVVDMGLVAASSIRGISTVPSQYFNRSWCIRAPVADRSALLLDLFTLAQTVIYPT
jgi:hypothetical protein